MMTKSALIKSWIVLALPPPSNPIVQFCICGLCNSNCPFIGKNELPLLCLLFTTACFTKVLMLTAKCLGRGEASVYKKRKKKFKVKSTFILSILLTALLDLKYILT